MDDLITIIIPVYNVIEYITKCLDSVLKQTYQNLEIIVVDDGSVDGSGHVCDEYAQKDSRIRVIHKENGGLSDARNAALAVCKGKYISFLDSDDWIENDFVEYLYCLAQKYNADVVECDFKYIDKNGHLFNSPQNDGNIFVFSSEEALEKLMQGNYIVTSATAKLYKRQIFDELRFPYGKFYEDIPVTYEVMLQNDCIVFGNRPLYNYFYRPGSISCRKFSEKRMDALYFLDESVDKVVNKYPHLKKQAEIAKFRMNFGILIELDNSEIANKYREEVYENVKKYRASTILSKNVNIKWRVKALLSVFGEKLIKKLFCRV